MPCINNYLSEYWTTLPPYKSRPLKTRGFHDNLMVSRRGCFHFCLEKLIFMRQLCRNPQFSGIFISICHIWLSCWQDTEMPNKVIVTTLSHLDTFRTWSQKLWWETMKIHQAKTKFKTEWEGSTYPVKRILSDPFSFLCLPYTWFRSFDAIDKPPGFSPNCQGRVGQSWVKITQGYN